MTGLRIYEEKKKKSDRASKITYVLAVAAGKGGVGKSTVATCLSLALKNLGLKVGLLDADVYGPSLQQMLPEGLEPAEDQENPETLLPAMTLGIPFISVAHFRKEASIVRAPIANGIIEQFLETVNWGELDVLVVDFPPGTGDIQLTLMQKGEISGAVVVTTPQEVALLDVRKAIQLFGEMSIPVVGVVENMSYLVDEKTGERFAPFGEGGGERLASEFSLPFLGQIPIDRSISRAGDEGKSLWDLAPESVGVAQFSSIGKQVWDSLEKLANTGLQVRQKDPCHIEVGKGDRWVTVSGADLQAKCPCARCEGQTQSDKKEVSILEFSPVGRYAMRFGFSTGCNRGIYPFSLLEIWLEI